ncbi:hypothetical protein D3C76_878140 [compost metagenome]
MKAPRTVSPSIEVLSYCVGNHRIEVHYLVVYLPREYSQGSISSELVLMHSA